MKCAIFKEALLQLQVELSSNRKTSHITHQRFSLKPNDCLLQLPSHLARLVFKAKTRTLDIRVNYKRKYKNGLHCAGLRVLSQMKDFTLQSFSMAPLCREASEKIGIFS